MTTSGTFLQPLSDMQGTTMNRIRPPFATASAAVSRLLLAGLSALPAAVLAQATAQTAPATATSPAISHQAAPDAKEATTRDRQMGMGQHDPARMQERIAKNQAELKDKLKITAAQESAWTAFTAAMTPPARAMQDRHAQHAEMQKLPTPQRIDKMRELRTQHMTEMMKRMDQRGEATKALYAALSPEQQKTFDLVASERGSGHAERHHGGKHGNS